jgi:hypothetical protein
LGWPSASDFGRLQDGLRSSSYSYVSGSTHAFYHYPARFSPAVARAVIETLSRPGDWVLDPFMGGGTAIIEGLCLGRKMLGVDINTLAHFVTRVRTTPLSRRDEGRIRQWATEAAEGLDRRHTSDAGPPQLENLPAGVRMFIADALTASKQLRSRRQRAFARCVLLRLGQWALDCREFVAPRRHRLARRLPRLTDEMLQGLSEFVELCRATGVAKSQITRDRRRLLCRSAVGLEGDPVLQTLSERPRLVFTSPPYPGVHVLYHRWQYRGRRETAAPYWIASLQDGRFESFYTGGSRTPTGRRRYFEMITSAFRSVRALIDPAGLVVQLVGFSDAAIQLPQYLLAMEGAGFEEWRPHVAGADRLGRLVPNRKWYARVQSEVDAFTEFLLFHRPS